MVLVELAYRNIILVVEFTWELELQRRTIVEAVIEAYRLRLCPVLVTSIAFIMGAVSLAVSAGVGMEMRHAIGMTVFAEMLGVVLFGLSLTPVFYMLLRTLAARHGQHPGDALDHDLNLDDTLPMLSTQH